MAYRMHTPTQIKIIIRTNRLYGFRYFYIIIPLMVGANRHIRMMLLNQMSCTLQRRNFKTFDIHLNVKMSFYFAYTVIQSAKVDLRHTLRINEAHRLVFRESRPAPSIRNAAAKRLRLRQQTQVP